MRYSGIEHGGKLFLLNCLVILYSFGNVYELDHFARLVVHDDMVDNLEAEKLL